MHSAGEGGVGLRVKEGVGIHTSLMCQRCNEMTNGGRTCLRVLKTQEKRAMTRKAWGVQVQRGTSQLPACESVPTHHLHVHSENQPPRPLHYGAITLDVR